MARTQQILTVDAGTDAPPLTLNLLRADNKTRINLTTANAVEVLFKYSLTDDDANARMTKTTGNGGVTIADLALGIVQIHIAATDTSNVVGPSQVAYTFVAKVFFPASQEIGAVGKLFIVPWGFKAITP